MTGKKILETLKDLKEKADEKDKNKQATKDKKEKDLENFLRCRDVCVCNRTPCCPSCRNVMKSVCSKVACRNEDGSKPNMIASTAAKLIYIAKVIQHFLVDEGGSVHVMTMQCLKPKTDSGTILSTLYQKHFY